MRLLSGLLLLRRNWSLLAWRHGARAVLQAALQEVVYRLQRYEVAFSDLGPGEVAQPDPPSHRVERNVQLLSCFLLRDPILGGHNDQYSSIEAT